jgi:hypothetical protein
MGRRTSTKPKAARLTVDELTRQAFIQEAAATPKS